MLPKNLDILFGRILEIESDNRDDFSSALLLELSNFNDNSLTNKIVATPANWPEKVMPMLLEPTDPPGSGEKICPVCRRAYLTE